MRFAAVHESALVKLFGCWPRRTMPQALAAGVRKPPREETAIWAVLRLLALLLAGGAIIYPLFNFAPKL
jgi:hypothetical protein